MDSGTLFEPLEARTARPSLNRGPARAMWNPECVAPRASAPALGTRGGPRAGAEARGATHSGFHIALAGPRFRDGRAVRASRGSNHVPEPVPANRSVSAG